MLRQPGAAAIGAIHLCHGAVHEFASGLLQPLLLLAQQRRLQARDQTLVRGVESQVLHPLLRAVQQGVTLLGSELPHRYVGRELPGFGVCAKLP